VTQCACQQTAMNVQLSSNREVSVRSLTDSDQRCRTTLTTADWPTQYAACWREISGCYPEPITRRHLH